MKITKYPDGASYAEAEKNIPQVMFTFKINSYEDLWHLNQIVDTYTGTGITPTITIPNLFDAQADRRFSNYQSSGLKLVCKLLNGMNAKFRIFHPHNPEVVEALIDNVEIMDNQRFISYVLNDIHKTYPAIMEDNYIGPDGYYRDDRLDKNIILMSADAGGFKPLMKLCDKLDWQGETYSASKSRQYLNSAKSKITQFVARKDFKGKDILIIDDISVYGGTFKGLSKLLRKANCGKLYLAVSHMTVQNLGRDNVCKYFDNVFTTNSKYNSYYCSYQVRDVGPIQTMEYIPDNLEIIKQF